MSADVEWTEVEVQPFGLNESVDRRVLPPGQLVEAINCDFSTLEGSVRKRPGTQYYAGPLTFVGGGLSVGFPDKLIPYDRKNQLLSAYLNNPHHGTARLSVTTGEADGLGIHNQASAAEISRFLVRQSPVAHDLQSDILSDVAFAECPGDPTSGVLVYGLLYQQTKKLIIKCVRVDKTQSVWRPAGTLVEKQILYSPSALTSVKHVRAAVSNQGTHVLVAWNFTTPSTPEIHGVVVDCSVPSDLVLGGALKFSALQFIAPSVNSPTEAATIEQFDICTVTSDMGTTPRWTVVTLVEDTLGKNKVRVSKLQSNAGLLGEQWAVLVPFASVLGDVTCRAPSILEKAAPSGAGRVWINYLEDDAIVDGILDKARWRYTVLNTDTGAEILASTAWAEGAAWMSPGNPTSQRPITAQSAIGWSLLEETAMMFSSQTVGFLSTNGWRPLNRTSGMAWRLVALSGLAAGSDVSRKRNAFILSKPWCDGGPSLTCNLWIGTQNLVGVSEDAVASGFPTNTVRVPESPVGTAALLSVMPASFTTGTKDLEKLQATAAGQVLGFPYGQTTSPATWLFNRLYMPQSVTDQRGGNVQLRLGARTTFNIRYLPIEKKSGPWDIVARGTLIDAQPPELHGRAQAADFGGIVHTAGGVLSSWDGARGHEVGFITPPSIEGIMEEGHTPWSAGISEQWAGQKLFMQALYEAVDAQGNVLRSATSNILEFELNSVDPGTGNNVPDVKIDIWLEPSTITLRRDVESVNTARVIATLYASAKPNDQVLHRLYKFDLDYWGPYTFNPDQLAPIGPITVVNHLWQTDIIIHAREANAIIYNDGGELDNDLPYGGCSCLAVHKDRLWIGGGIDPEVLWYSKERVDGRPAEFALGQQLRIAGHEVMALASLDDALIVFCTQGVFSVFGEGPDATGNAASGFFSVVPIDQTIRCVSPHTAKFPGGIVFQSESGIYMLTRQRQLKSIGDPVSKILSRMGPLNAIETVDHLHQIRFVGSQPAELDSLYDVEVPVLVYDWRLDKWSVWEYSTDSAQIVDLKTLNGVSYYLLDNNNGWIIKEDPSVFSDLAFIPSGDGGIINEGIPYRQRLRTGWLSFGRTQGYKRLRKLGILMENNPWDSYVLGDGGRGEGAGGLYPVFPFGLFVGMDFNYAEYGFGDSVQWDSLALQQIAAQDGITNLRVYIPKQKQPSIRITLEERDPLAQVIGNDPDQFVTVAIPDNAVLRVNLGDGFVNVPFEPDYVGSLAGERTEAVSTFITVGTTQWTVPSSFQHPISQVPGSLQASIWGAGAGGYTGLGGGGGGAFGRGSYAPGASLDVTVGGGSAGDSSQHGGTSNIDTQLFAGGGFSGDSGGFGGLIAGFDDVNYSGGDANQGTGVQAGGGGAGEEGPGVGTAAGEQTGGPGSVGTGRQVGGGGGSNDSSGQAGARGQVMLEYNVPVVAGRVGVRDRVARRITSPATSHTLTLPSHISGDLLLLCISAAGSAAISVPGWTQLVQQSATGVGHAVFWRRATSGAVPTTVNLTASEPIAYNILTCKHAGTPSASIVTGATGNPGGVPHNAGVVKDHLWVTSYGIRFTAFPIVAPAPLYDALIGTSPAVSTSVGCYTMERQIAATSSETPGTFTSAAVPWVSATIAVPPRSYISKANVVEAINAAFGKHVAALDGAFNIHIFGPFVEIDSEANGSNMNSALGLSSGQSFGTPSVLPYEQAGFALQTLAFEVGHIKGIRRMSANQSR